MRDYIALTKPRITWLILMSTGVGYFFGLKRHAATPASPDWILLLHTLIGTGADRVRHRGAEPVV